MKSTGVKPLPPSTVYQNGRLHLQGYDLTQIAKKHGTPTYVYSLDRVKQKLEYLRRSFVSPTLQAPLHVHYSVKSNSNETVLRALQKLGVGVDVVSAGEIARALTCGFKGKDIIFSGVGKSVVEIEFAMKSKIHLFNVESPQELERIGVIARRLSFYANVSFRINPNVNPKTHPYITTGFRENKFGMDKSFLPELIRILKKNKSSLKLVGLDFHIGSQLHELHPFYDATEHAVKIYNDLRALGFALKYMDIGGGMGIPYEPGAQSFDMATYGAKICKILAPLKCEILCEPGRYIVGDAGVLLTQVEYVKKSPYKTFVIVNTGMHHLIRPSLYGAFHHIAPLVDRKRPVSSVDVVGPICESGDFLAKKRKLAEVKQGEILAVLDAGAYGYVMASDYNLHAKPAEVILA